MQITHLGIMKSQGHGLGNQMFLIASTIGIAIDNNADYGFPTWKNNQYFKNTLPFIAPGAGEIVKEKSWDYNPVKLPNKPFIFLDGYFQSYKYFENAEVKVRQAFVFKEQYVEEVNKILTQTDSGTTCSIHVRRGDYLNYPNIHPQQSADYWFNAQTAIEMYNDINTYIVFSDDIAWCKANAQMFKRTGKKVLFFQGRNQIDDFIGISRCHHNIITNSTFSWWAAWLDENINKTVVMPKIWFGKEGPWSGPTEANDLQLKEWIRL